MKFTVCLLALSFCAVISAVDESTTESDLVITTLPAIPENDVSSNDNDDVPVKFLRQSDTVDSESTTVHFSELACTRDNMEWLACGPRCYQTCGYQPRDGREVNSKLQRKSKAYCASSNDTGCYAGCYCKSGYVRFHDDCILPIQCPSKRLITVKCNMPCWLLSRATLNNSLQLSFFFYPLSAVRPCGLNEVYRQCGTPCQLNCDNYAQRELIEDRCPNDICISGCFCRTGYVRALTGLCVLPTRCQRPLVV